MIWKVIVSLGVIVSLIIGFCQLSDRIATAEDVKQLRQETKDTFQAIRIDMDKKFLQQRYDSLTDQMWKYKLHLQQHPNDSAMKEEYEAIMKEREDLKNKLSP